ncbi:hypothetical protein A2125_00995 [Candidatus Woesebacteria bacterium GWB1_43_5]|uniref:Prepilin-type N-terminal cleavage/methylation domain-containing protein n=1 Tax=Candidatus Woesebacteria bacterium GWB1_43_5 TaxID=1802474 RepID=A0A1F7WSX3_9BACT|nr:MAG: hypothetical protein A2125_00995 [Candidatus Woesebacteria bacterium GWB1_43_5]
MKIRKNRLFGFSLIEILLYMGLLGIFLFSLTNLFVSSIDVRLESEAKSSVEQDGRYLLSRFRYDISQASQVLLPVGVGDQGDSLQIARGGVNYTYSLVDGNIIVSDGASQDQLNSSRVEVTSLNFQRLGNVGGKNTVTITYALSSRTIRPQGPEVRNYELVFGIR